ncbi:unnamed protein product [Pedinophyceae sp. YPF-701]|nr:unnamed protein product [Pedinophyceae sp. YPF-701]
MPKKSGKSKSKRVSLKQKYKVIKKVREHHRKQRRAAKKEKTGSTKIKALKKDPGIPRNWPFRDELVQELQMQRLHTLDQEQRRKEERKRLVEQAQEDKLAEMQANAVDAAEAYAQRGDGAAGGADFDRDRSRRSFFKEFRKVVESADIILFVLDARDPLSCRCPEVERYIRRVGAEKRIVLLLNKVDMVPREATEAWLKYFREELPTLPFRSSTQNQSKLGQKSMRHAGDAVSEGSAALGVESLLQLLKNYARSHNIKTSVTVGVIGLPNVGKSSIINSLKRSRVANVGNAPGITKVVQEIALDKHVRLLDCPGIVFTAAESEDASALRNCVKVEKLEDPVGPCGIILQRVPAKQLMQMYRIPAFKNVDQFLAHVAKARGRLRSGGTPDIPGAARMVLQDWNAGKIPFFTMPPARANRNVREENAEVVQAMAAEFDMAALQDHEVKVLQALPGADQSEWTQTEGLGQTQVDMEEMDGEEEEDEEEDEDAFGDESDMDEEVEDEEAPDLEAIIAQKRAEGRANAAPASQNEVLYAEAGQHNPKAARAARKKLKKGRQAKAASAGSDSDYDFDEAFDKDEDMA